MRIAAESKRPTALVVIDTANRRYSHYVGTQRGATVQGAWISPQEVEHFRINPTDFIAIHCGPEAA